MCARNARPYKGTRCARHIFSYLLTTRHSLLFKVNNLLIYCGYVFYFVSLVVYTKLEGEIWVRAYNI